MGRKTIYTDDIDGSDIGENASPIVFSVGRNEYTIYLNDKNHEKFLDTLKPYTDVAESRSISRVPVGPGGRPPGAASNADKERNQKVRTWAQSTNFKFKNAAGEETTLGDRGRIPQEIYDAYDAAN